MIGGLLQYNTFIVLTGVSLLGLVSGVLGCYLVLRRRALVSDAVAHSALPGLCVAFLIIQERHFAGLLLGAFVFGLIGSWLIGWIRRKTRIKEDAAIGIVLSVLFGIGLSLSSYIQNTIPGANKAGLDSFIFGKTAGMLASDVYGILAVCAAVFTVVAVFSKEFKVISFDPDFTASLGWPVAALDFLMMGLACVTVIVGLPAVGLALVAALLIIPGASARFWTDRLGTMMMLSGAFGLITGLTGALASAKFANLPAGPIIILSGTAIFLISLFAAPRRGLFSRLWRRAALNQRIETQNFLRTMFELSEAQWPKGTSVKLSDLQRLRAWNSRKTRRLIWEALNDHLIRPAGEGYALTEKGWQRGADVVRVHRMWEIFLIEEAQVAPSLVDRDAERIEHVLPEETVTRLEKRLRELNLTPAPFRDLVPERHPSIARGEQEALQS